MPFHFALPAVPATVGSRRLRRDGHAGWVPVVLPAPGPMEVLAAIIQFMP